MISETITIPKTISDQEDRFVLKLKENLLRMIKEINKNSKKIGEITNEEHEDPDYTDEFNKKANVDASNIGYGDLFIEQKNDENEVIYDADDNRADWGMSLTNDKNTIAEDNVTLVSSQNVYAETHPYMKKDGEGNWINPYHYINYKNLTTNEGAEDINKQDRWSDKDVFQPHEPNDNKVKENLIALDTAIWEVSEALEVLDEMKANINLDNLTKKDPRSSAQDNTLYGQTVLMNSTHIVSDHENIFVNYEDVYNSNINQWVRVYHIDTDFDPGGGSDPLKANVDASNVGGRHSGSTPDKTQNKKDWGTSLGIQESQRSHEGKALFSDAVAADDGIGVRFLDDSRLVSASWLYNEARGGLVDNNLGPALEFNAISPDLCLVGKEFTVSENLRYINDILIDLLNNLESITYTVTGETFDTASSLFEGYGFDSQYPSETYSYEYDIDQDDTIVGVNYKKGLIDTTFSDLPIQKQTEFLEDIINGSQLDPNFQTRYGVLTRLHNDEDKIGQLWNEMYTASSGYAIYDINQKIADLESRVQALENRLQ